MNLKHLTWQLPLLILIGAVVFLWLVKAPIMSWYLTQKIGVPVSMSSISIRPTQTMIADFRIKNPHGFAIKNALTAQNTTIDYRTKQLFGDLSEIDLIQIDDISLSIILTSPTGDTNNWTAIGAGMPADDEKSNAPERDVVVHRLVLNNLNVQIQGGAKLLKLPPTKHIDQLVFNEVSSKKGFPTKELIKAIFQGAGIDQYIKQLFSPEKLLNPKLILGDIEE
jgi:hypothetical protein